MTQLLKIFAAAAEADVDRWQTDDRWIQSRGRII